MERITPSIFWYREMNKDVIASIAPIMEPAELLGGFVLLAAIVYSICRTGSLHLVRCRLWLVLFGKEAIADEQIRSFVAARSSLIAFRFNAGVPARTLDQANRMVAWANGNDEDIYAIAAAGKYFDREELRLKESFLPIQMHRGLVLLSAGLAILLGLKVADSSWSTRGYYKIRDSGLSFTASSTDIQESSPGWLTTSFPWGTQPSHTRPLTVEMCKERKIPPDVFAASQATALCGFLESPDRDKMVAQAVREQRNAAAFLAGLYFAVWILLVRNLYYLRTAIEMKGRLEKRTKQPELQLE